MYVVDVFAVDNASITVGNGEIRERLIQGSAKYASVMVTTRTIQLGYSCLRCEISSVGYILLN